MIDWENFDKQLKNIKYKYLLIFKFFNLLEYFDDTNASITLRYIINNNMDIFIEHPFHVLLEYIPQDRYPETTRIILMFYKLIKDKLKVITLLIKWYGGYKNETFWNKDIANQIIHLKNLKLHIQGIFDNSMNGVPFGMKILPILQSNINNSREIVIDTCIERLSTVYKLLGVYFFILANIPTITVETFISYSNENKCNYINILYDKTNRILSQTIELFEDFNMINLQMDNLLNPINVNIEEDTTIDADVEDIILFF